jgi:hypothetical protein
MHRRYAHAHTDKHVYIIHMLIDSYMCVCAAESNNEVVKGLDFHKYYFDAAAKTRDLHKAAPSHVRHSSPLPSPLLSPPPLSSPLMCMNLQSTLTGVEARLLSGKSAVIAANRLVQRPDRTDQFGETRVWQVQGGRWKQVHFQRAAAGATAALLSSHPAARST